VKQLGLFDQPRKLARKSHPVESHEAAAKVAISISDMEEDALQVVKDHPGCTGNELNAFAGATRGEVSKRLAGLMKKGLVEKLESRKCELTGMTCATWRAV
jgi:uncharacterized membrane protein